MNCAKMTKYNLQLQTKMRLIWCNLEPYRALRGFFTTLTALANVKFDEMISVLSSIFVAVIIYATLKVNGYNLDFVG